MELKELLQPEHIAAAYDPCDCYDEDGSCDELQDEMNFEDACYELTTYIKEHGNTEKTFSICMTGFGWRNTSGSGMATFDDGKELLQKVLPERTPCTWKAYRDGDKLVIRNWHHDSPMGNEYYYIEPVPADDYYAWKEEHAQSHRESKNGFYKI